jgi:hypothetical protein
MKIVYKAVGAPPMVKIIPNSIEAMERLMGGNVEVVKIEDGLFLAFAKDGNDLGLDAHLATVEYDMVYGDAIVTARDGFGSFRDLDNYEVRKAVALLTEMEI